MKFRKKPVVIDAVRIEKGMDLPQWLIAAMNEGRARLRGASQYSRVQPWAEIDTLEGMHRGDAGDWIIRGVKGELYPCKPDIFDATYEPVDDER